MRPLRAWRLAAQIYGLSLLTMLVVGFALMTLLMTLRPPEGLLKIVDHMVKPKTER